LILGLLEICLSEYKNNEHELYNSIGTQSKKGLIKCPDCNNNIGMHGTYKRKIIISEFDIQTVNIIQVRCKKCRKVHAVIPGFILPKKQYDINSIKKAVIDKEILTCTADDSTIRRWRASLTKSWYTEKGRKMNYKTYKLEELTTVLNDANPVNPDKKSDPEDVYNKLFAGMDFKLLSLMCTQIKWSLASKKVDGFLKIIDEYADRVIEIAAAWKDLCKIIVERTGIAAKDFNNICRCYFNSRENELPELFLKSKKMLESFYIEIEPRILSISSKQNNLANYLAEAVYPETKNIDIRKYREHGLELCLGNEKLIKGTESSLRNASLFFSFINSSIEISIKIISDETIITSDEIVFTIHGQAGLWEVFSDVTHTMSKYLGEFKYKDFPVIK